MNDKAMFTYQTRLRLVPAESDLLDTFASLYGKAERTLFAALQAGGAINGNINALKRECLVRFGITARQFNAMRIGLGGKIASIKERRPELIRECQRRINQAKKIIRQLEETAPGTRKLHEKKRRLGNLQYRCARMAADEKTGIVRLCFGSRRRFHAQFHLAANGYASHDDWLRDWQDARSNQFYVVGSMDELAGCQECQAMPDGDGTLTLRLRLPHCLKQHGTFLTIPGVRFAYGHDKIIAALAASLRVSGQNKNGETIKKRIGVALSYRFVRDQTSWRLYVSFAHSSPGQVSRRSLGAIGVDINVGHLDLAELDRFGNLTGFERIPANVYGASKDQASAILCDVALRIVDRACLAGKPVVIEELDFCRKKCTLESFSYKQSRMLSSFAYRKAISAIKAAAFRAGVQVIEVNPAYTSVIGATSYACKYGVSPHMGAALSVARRGMRLSERLPQRYAACVPVRNGGHVTLALPDRNRAKHVWSAWAVVSKDLKAAHVAHYRSGDRKKKPVPLSPEQRTLCTNRSSPVRSRRASQPNRSAGGMANVPFG